MSSEITHPGCRPRYLIGKATRYDGDKWQRVVYRPRGVEDPEHAWTLYVREPGDLSGTRRQTMLAGRPGKVCGRNPGMYATEKSDTGIVTEESAEQNWMTIGGGAGGKAGDQGKFLKRRLRLVRRDRRKH